jgi:hypothetical protein
MNIAYLISAHTDAPQLARLIRALHADAEFFIHIDKKSDIRPFEEAITAKNVHFIEKRIDVRWGTLIEVEYQMALIRAAVQHPRHFDHIFFLSGMDYPLWSNEHITRWLEEQGDRETLQGICMDTEYIQGQQRELYTRSRPLFRLFGNKWDQKLSILCRKALGAVGYRKRLSFRIGLDTWHLYKGSAWWCISEELARYVLETYQQCPEVKRYFRDSFGQAETIIQTIAFNSPQWAPKCIRSEGPYPGLDALTPLHFIIYEPVIKVMDETDYPALVASGKMFARKFRSGQSEKIIELLNANRKKIYKK